MCKNIFNICLGDSNDSKDGIGCSFGSYESKVVEEDDIKFKMNVFDEKLSRLIFPFQQWKVRKAFFFLIFIRNDSLNYKGYLECSNFGVQIWERLANQILGKLNSRK